MSSLNNSLIHRLFGLLERPNDLGVVQMDTLFDSPIALVLTDVRPRVLYVRDGALIDRLCVGYSQLQEHLTGDSFAIQLLRSHFIENLVAQLMHLFYELRPQL